MARLSEPCELTASIVVACSVQQCWNIYIDNTQLAHWAPAVSNVECAHATVNLDTVRKSSVAVDGKSGHTVEQCTVFEPLKRIEFTVLEETFGFAHMLNSYGFGMSFDADGEHTLLVMTTHFVPKKIFASLMTSRSTQLQLIDLMTEALDGFKQYAQSGIKPENSL